MLVRRLLLLLSGYAVAIGLVLTVIMLVPGLLDSLNARYDGVWTRLLRGFTPLPGLWLILLPTALMLTVLIAISRLNLRGEIRQWRAAGASVWPFARATSLIALLIAGLMAGPLWTWTQPEGVTPIALEKSNPLFIDTFGEPWTLPIPATATASDEPTAGTLIALFSLLPARRTLTGQIAAVEADGTILLQDAQITADPAGEAGPARPQPVRLTPQPGATGQTAQNGTDAASSPRSQSQNRAVAGLGYRLSYPVLVVGLSLLILPLALSIDGNRWTLLKIAAGCLLALNILFVLLMTDAMVRAGFWDESWFFPLRGAMALGLGLLALTVFEERAA
ncbi:MAG: LptF/LptG family permease [Pseudomonadota bacterium]|nr:LptF/LptG family permease [Pseudomonadota bacterium]